jgi:hypothetical protein
MEEKPAGRITSSNDLIDSPKKKSNPIGIESQWSFGWQGNSKDVFNRPNSSKGNTPYHSGFNLYHNQSSISFGDTKTSDWKNEEPTKSTNMKKKKEVDNEKPVWNYNPKTAGKTTMVLGTDKIDYRKKDEVYKERTPTTLTNSRRK